MGDDKGKELTMKEYRHTSLSEHEEKEEDNGDLAYAVAFKARPSAENEEVRVRLGAQVNAKYIHEGENKRPIKN